LAGLDDAAFRTRFAKSPIKRIGRDRFLRNVLIAIGNSQDATLTATVRPLLDDPSPLVRGAATWALTQLSPQEAASERAQRLATEQDATVLEEWQTSDAGAC
jgi:epoxyqueuosine reductase